jgi:endonuclease G
MAKKKASSSKKKPSRSKKGGNKQSKSNFPLLLVISILLLGLVLYGLNETAQLSKITSLAKSSLQSSNSTTKTDIASNSANRNNSASTKEESVEEKKMDSENIATLDGAKESTKTNKNLPIYTKDDNYYYSSSFDFAWPAYQNADQIVEHAYFTLSYNEKTEQADWVAYKLTKSNLSNAKFKRKDNFRSDPDVKTKSASLQDYKGSGYDRGHLAPAADFTWTEQGLDDSFFMSNMSPQDPGFNRGIWKKLEGKVRTWANSNEKIYVVTGPVYKGQSEKIGKNKVAVPDKYFKIILDLTGKEVKGIAFILDNEKSSKDLSHFAMSIDKAERITGFDFFPSIPDELEKKIESTYGYELW